MSQQDCEERVQVFVFAFDRSHKRAAQMFMTKICKIEDMKNIFN